MEFFNFDVNKCIECKKILNKNQKSRIIYRNKCSFSKFIGNCTNLYQKLNPTSYKDFYDKELKYAEENHHLPVEERGLTYEEFYMLAYKYKILLEDCTNLKYDISIYFYALVCHAIIETFIGQKKEEVVLEYINNKGFTASKVDSKKDTRYGVDIEVEGKGQHFYVQVKPLTFFTSNYSDVNNDRLEACKKREEIMSNEGLDTYYIIYDLDWETSQLKWLFNKKDTVLFKISDLFKYDKEDIKNTFERIDLDASKLFDTLP